MSEFYRSRPIVVEAEVLSVYNINKLEQRWNGGMHLRGRHGEARMGDYIVRTIEGKVEAIPPQEFEAKFIRVASAKPVEEALGFLAIMST